MASIPQMQRAVQLIGPDRLTLNDGKKVVGPGPFQVLAKVEAVGLCYSDLKLLKQFSDHARKSRVVNGISANALSEMPNYVPGDKPTVPGHEAVVRIAEIGANVTRHNVGDRYLVQTDYRWLPTAGSNAAFGYNFEGALQEYVLMDERVIISPAGESMLIAVPEELSASALALVEPWACVENAYVEKQRRSLKDGGRLLVVGEVPVGKSRVQDLPGTPAAVTFATSREIGGLKDTAFDDVVAFGVGADTVEKLFPKIAPAGLFIIVQDGKKFGRAVVSQVGRIHYGGIRLIGTTGSDANHALSAIPRDAEIRANSKINVIGAAGPMGTMHVIRALSTGVPGLSVFAGDLNDERLASLEKVVGHLAHKHNARLRPYNPSKEKLAERFDYFVIMAPAPVLAAQSIEAAAPHAVINIFAGIPAEVTFPLDLDTYIERQLYFVGTSGSVLENMKQVLSKVVARRLDTNLSVAAVAGLDGAIDGIRAVETNTMQGKILVYPSCAGLKLTPLSELGIPLTDGHWNRSAEKALLNRFAAP